MEESWSVERPTRHLEPMRMSMMETAHEHNPDASSKGLSQHPLGAIFPPLSEEEFDALAKDIKEHGLHEEIVLYEEKVLDGWNRHLACRRVGAEPKYIVYTGHDPRGFVISHNIRRRHLTASQRALVAARVSTLPLGSNQYDGHQGLPVGRAAELFGVGERSVARAKVVLASAIKEVIDALESGQLTVSRAAKIAQRSKDQQRAMQLNSWRMPSPQVTTCTPAIETNALVKSGPVQELDSALGIAGPLADGSTDCQNEITAAPEEALPPSHEAPLAVPAGIVERVDTPTSLSRADIKRYDKLTSRWRKHNVRDWKALPTDLRIRFITEELHYAVKAQGSGTVRFGCISPIST
jgi:hypothetical protein